MKRFIIILATGAYSGYVPGIPGTAGSLVGMLIYYWIFSRFPPALYVISAAAFFSLAWWVSEQAELILAEKDSPRIVIDEVVGSLITMAFLPRTLTAMLGGFLFFRLFDIIKIPPAGAIDQRMKGGLAVVLDDVVAGVYANLLLQVTAQWDSRLLVIVDRWFCGPG